MIILPRLTIGIASILVLFITTLSWAQKTNYLNSEELPHHTKPAPESVFKSFREAGMQPVNHALTPAEKEKVDRAFGQLPPVHQRILKQHLHSISFMDNMPNTALTSPVDSAGVPKLFNITFRATLLNENISDWATTKENTCFTPDENAKYKVRVQGGRMDAMVYVLMHEATHVIDAVTNITPHPEEATADVEPTLFTKDIWRKMNVPAAPYIDSLLEKTRFRSGKPVPVSLAPDVYARLSKTPFPSLYATAAWFEDIAELATIYHLTAKLSQPFYIIVTKDNAEVARFEPMKNALVRQRLAQLERFYKL